MAEHWFLENSLSIDQHFISNFTFGPKSQVTTACAIHLSFLHMVCKLPCENSHGGHFRTASNSSQCCVLAHHSERALHRSPPILTPPVVSGILLVCGGLCGGPAESWCVYRMQMPRIRCCRVRPAPDVGHRRRAGTVLLPGWTSSGVSPQTETPRSQVACSALSTQVHRLNCPIS